MSVTAASKHDNAVADQKQSETEQSDKEFSDAVWASLSKPVPSDRYTNGEKKNIQTKESMDREAAFDRVVEPLKNNL